MSNSETVRDGVRKSIGEKIVGRGRELDLLWAAVAAGRHILLEGPPGTSKTTMLKAITSNWGVPLVMVEGNAELTPAKLIGHHSPFQVMRDDYSAENFVPGPLVTAMQQGGFLYIEELNRAPEDSLNALLVAIADKNITIPRVGVIQAKQTFRVVASMNPYDNVGTYRLSRSILDRLCRLAVGYQDERSEREIVVSVTSQEIPTPEPKLVADAVAVTRATRAHPLIKQGSSVRGAIDLVLVVHALHELRGGLNDTTTYPDLVHDAMIVALSGRIELDPTADTTPEDILHTIWQKQFNQNDPPLDAGLKDLEIANNLPRTNRGRLTARSDRIMRKPKALTTEPTVFDATSGVGRNTWAEFGAARGRAVGNAGSSALGTSADVAESTPAPTAVAIDPTVAAMVKKISAQLSVSRPSRAGAARRGAGEMRSVPYGGSSDDIDLDQTLERILDHPIPSERDIIVRERIRTKRAIVLAVDLSGSMRGERIKTTAAAVGALAGRLTRDDLAVLAFWSDAAWIVHLGQAFNPDEIVSSLLEVPARGLTNLAFPLELAADELASTGGVRARVILLSDCVHNAGPDPRSSIGRLPRLDILLDTEGQHDRELAGELAHRGRGQVHGIHSYRDVAPALTEIFSHD